ncbi:PIN domain-containing protein [Sulfurovum sp. bin170]|uniref:PIN domain-containing protein n=1 Tax=Sulfurovum sp. bin170 TaxID=2695268 RepID=UPI0013DFCB78|nr:PIN domain-containing protein [Sulfurovum sp. bin170]NEW61632.1 PIN domain-containing protein [Sulfurovum sp. bin170]
MSDKVFLDTNIVIYSYSEDEPEKQEIANDILEQYSNQIIISNQVINELSNTLFRKFKLNADEVRETVLELNDNFPIVNFNLQTQLKGIELKGKYKLQFYDSMILATALENGCNIVFSEDMQHNQVIENQLTIINPFRDIKSK